jgi:hypothetical protein
MGTLVMGKDVLMNAMEDAGLLSADVHGYCRVEVAEVGERDGKPHGCSIKDALEEVRVRLDEPYAAGLGNMYSLVWGIGEAYPLEE